MVTVVVKLTCLMEVLLDTQCDLQEFTKNLAKLVSTSSVIWSTLSSNLVVLVKSYKPGYRHLAEWLVKLEAFGCF